LFTFFILQQVLSKFPPDSHSVIKPARVPVTRVLNYVSNKFEVSTTFRFRKNLRHGTGETDWQTDRMQHYCLSFGRVEQCVFAAGASRDAKTATCNVLCYFGDIWTL